MKRVLVACECSGQVRRAFRERGFEAWSNDLKPAVDGSQYHIQGDCLEAIPGQEWDLIVMHPPCTAMTLSGNRWYGKGKPRHHERLEAVEWTRTLWDLACSAASFVALENPTGVLFSHLSYDTLQYIQPWQFGHGEVKRTGFALKGLPPLEPTDIVDGRDPRVLMMSPSADRQAIRSETYPGIAAAIAAQWGHAILNEETI